MRADELQRHLDAAREALLTHEARLTARLEAVLNRHADAAVRKFKQRALTLTAAGVDWVQPNGDELVDSAALQSDLMGVLRDTSGGALDSFGKHLPECVVPAVPQARKAGGLDSGVDRDELRRLLSEMDAAKRAGATTSQRRKWMDAIRELTGMSPTAARKALEDEQGAFNDSVSMLHVAPPTPVDTSDRMAVLKAAFNESEKSLHEYTPSLHNVNRIKSIGATFKEEVEARAGAMPPGAVRSPSDLAARNAAVHARRQAIFDILNEVRGVGPSGDMKLTLRPIEGVDARMSNQMAQAVSEAYEQLPRDWADLISQFTDGNPLTLRHVDRGYYLGVLNTIGLSGVDRTALSNTALHEFGHFVEDIHPAVVQLERTFYDMRTAGESLEALDRPGIAATEGARSEVEVVKPDEFTLRYIGRWYGGNAYELLSMGLEYILGSEPGNFYTMDKMWRDDPEYVQFILGIMMGVA